MKQATLKEYQERFMKRVEMIPECGCWIWTGGEQGPDGHDKYGSFLYEGKARRAHRISYLLFRGEFDLTLDVLHKCDTTLCVNPSHLFLGTHKDNMRDMLKKGRGKPFTSEIARYHGKMSGLYRKSKSLHAHHKE